MSTTPPRQTPMMRQYRAIKARHPNALLFFRMGDFYEMFFEDAEIASRALNLTLTTRDRNSESPVPMAGFPWHAADRYISRLIRLGHRVVVCDQVEDPATARGLVERAVTEIVTPGTALTENLLEARENNFIAAVTVEKGRAGLALADVSTGEFAVEETAGENLAELLERSGPREIVIAEETTFPNGFGGVADDHVDVLNGQLVTERPGWHFTIEEGEETLRRHFGIASLEGLGLGPLGPALGAAGALLRYLKEVRGADLKHITAVRRLDTAGTMFLDEATRRHLEIFRPAWPDGPDTSLLAVLDRTATAPGARRLRAWLEEPLLDRHAIERRLEAVAELAAATAAREALAPLLKRVHDLERLLGRAACGKAGPRDLKVLGETALLTPALREAAAPLEAPRLKELAGEIEDLSPLGGRLAAAIVDNPPALAGEAGIFREGYNAELDELRRGNLTSRQWIAALQERERARTGIPSLKVGYNKVFGYYLEVTRAHQALVPPDYIRKQTLVGAERYVTPDLKDEESRVLGAEERIKKLEAELFRELREQVVAEARPLRRTAAALAELDVYIALAVVARERGYVRPAIVDEPVLCLREARHPVVEKLLPPGEFVPNDLDMDSSARQFLIITGPNMAGKSTYLRQAALIVLLAQIGSFVPAGEATVGVVDRIFTRIGASDHIARGRSTFMVEMQETAAILRNATPRSLVVLDEVGRGTSTFDGLSIAWAVAEYLHDGPPGQPRTLFATHYHELTHLARDLARVVNLNVLVREWNDEVRFLHRIVPGAADRSYGIQVARLAGLPGPVLDRAREVLNHLEAGRFDRVEMSTHETAKLQLELFTPAFEEWRLELRKLDPERMTPLEALAALDRLRKKFAEDSEEDGGGPLPES